MRLRENRKDYISDFIVNDLFSNDESERICYEKNRIALNQYRFWMHDKLPEFTDLNVRGRITRQNVCVCYDTRENQFMRIFSVWRTNRVENPFFRDLSKQILCRNEMNTYHWEYLYDNVRKSEDFGGDNHVYMFYERIEDFICFLQVRDISFFLKKEQFIFLFGEEDLKNYPMNFEKRFGINYSTVSSKPIRIDEIHRIFVSWRRLTCSGIYFLTNIIDFHKNILTIREFGLSDFSFLYDRYLRGKTVDEFELDFEQRNMDSLVYESVSHLFGNISYCSLPLTSLQPRKFFSYLKIVLSNCRVPKPIEWFKGFYLAYSMACNRNDLNSRRVSPAIWFNTHYDKVRFGGIAYPGMYNGEILAQFKYCSYVSPMRYPIVAAGSITSKMIKNKKMSYKWLRNLNINLVNPQNFFVRRNDMDIVHTVFIRFEDLKLHPRATLESLCDFLDIEWDNVLLKTTANGEDISAFGTSGFETDPVYKRYFDIFSPFDYYRLEMIMSKCWRYWGYEPICWKDGTHYTKNEIKNLLSVHFKFEEISESGLQKTDFDKIRKIRYKYVEKILTRDGILLDENGEEMIPIPWLKPKEEFLEDEICR